MSHPVTNNHSKRQHEPLPEMRVQGGQKRICVGGQMPDIEMGGHSISAQVMELIFSFLPPKDLGRASLVCKGWEQLTNGENNALWGMMWQRACPDFPLSSNYREAFQDRVDSLLGTFSRTSLELPRRVYASEFGKKTETFADFIFLEGQKIYARMERCPILKLDSIHHANEKILAIYEVETRQLTAQSTTPFLRPEVQPMEVDPPSHDGICSVRDIKTGKELSRIPIKKQTPVACGDNYFFRLNLEDCTKIDVIDLNSGNCLGSFEFFHNVTHLSYCLGRLIAVSLPVRHSDKADEDLVGALSIFDVTSRQCLKEHTWEVFKGIRESYDNYLISNGKVIVFLDSDAEDAVEGRANFNAMIIDLHSGEYRMTLDQGVNDQSIFTSCCSEDKFFTFDYLTDTLSAWNTNTGEHTWAIPKASLLEGQYAQFLVCNGSQLFLGCRDFQVRVFDVASGERVGTLNPLNPDETDKRTEKRFEQGLSWQALQVNENSLITAHVIKEEYFQDNALETIKVWDLRRKEGEDYRPSALYSMSGIRRYKHSDQLCAGCDGKIFLESNHGIEILDLKNNNRTE